MTPSPKFTKYSITYPQCKISKEKAGELLKLLEGAKAVVVAHESHSDGADHLHAYIEFKKRGRRQTEYFDIEGHHGNVQGCRNVKDWIRYITKEDKEPWEWNFDTKACKEKKNARLSVKRAAEMPYEELRTKVRPDQLQKTLAGIQLDKLLTAKIEDLDRPCGIWLSGPAGTGKSHDVREYSRMAGIPFYEKSHNKWWDGYDGEPIVLLDDAHVEDKGWLAKFLKLWADAYAFKAETKGGMINIRPKHFIVTSNYGPDEFAQHEEDRPAIMRRFKFHFITKYDEALAALKEDIGKPMRTPEQPDTLRTPPAPGRTPDNRLWNILEMGPLDPPVAPDLFSGPNSKIWPEHQPSDLDWPESEEMSERTRQAYEREMMGDPTYWSSEEETGHE